MYYIGEHVIELSGEQYRKIFDRVYEKDDTWYTRLNLISNSFDGKYRKTMDVTDINQYLKGFNGRLGEIRKSYNPYVWRQELIFKTQKDATLFVLTEL
jgi:hypothetical protein